MIRNLSFLVFFIGIGQVLAQDQILKIDYDLYINGFSISKMNSELFVTDEYSVFVWNDTISKYEEEESLADQIEFTLHFADSIGTMNYYSKTKDSIISRSIGLEGIQIVKEKRTNIAWDLHPEVKNIGQFECNKATCTFRGRDYVVWYTPDIPVFFGPWKLHGLPGLILEVMDKEGMFKAFFKKFSYDERDMSQYVNVYKTGKVLSIKEYAVKQRKLGDELIKRMKLNLPRELNISIDGMKQNHLERDFN
ncbi:MAG: GLPGLI family protein [Eudoraea sp.]|nr:GLPGLI family protein [Eudoraea sp.]